MIVLDFPDPNSIELAKLYSLSFYQLLQQHLSPQGIIVQQSTSPLLAKKSFLCIGKTMKKSGLIAFAYRQNIPSFGEWGWWIATQANTQSQGNLTKNAEEEFLKKLKKVRMPKVKLQYLHDELFQAALVFGKDFFQESTSLKVNTRLNNIIFHYYLDATSDLVIIKLYFFPTLTF